MSESIGIEVQFFLNSIFWGVLILVIYDVIRIFRRVVPHNNFFQAVEDIIFWVVSAILIFRMMYIGNNGIIRGFSILGMVLGMLVYSRSLSGLFVKYTSLAIQKVCFFMTKPLRWLFKKIKKLICWLNKKVKKQKKPEDKRTKVLKKVKKAFKITSKKK